MTDRLAIVLAVLILAGLAVDHFANQGAATFYLAHKVTDFIDFLQFWR